MYKPVIKSPFVEQDGTFEPPLAGDVSPPSLAAVESPGHRIEIEKTEEPGGGAASQSPPTGPGGRSRQMAERIVTEARRQAEVIEQTAYQEGFAQGERAGMEFGQQKIEPIAKTLDSIVQSLLRVRENMIKQVESELIHVAFAIATRILHKELLLHPEDVLGVAREALKRTVRGVKMTMRINPVDLQYFQQAGKILPELAKHSERLVLQPDYEVTRGGVIVETESGEIDATLESQLTLLWEALNPEAKRKEPEEEGK